MSCEIIISIRTLPLDSLFIPASQSGLPRSIISVSSPICFKSKNMLRSFVTLPVGRYTISFDFQNKRNTPSRINAVPTTISAMLMVEDLSCISKIETKIRRPTTIIANEMSSPETLVRFAISGCEDAKRVASIVLVAIL